MIGLFLTPYQKIYVMVSPRKPMKFKVGISTSPKIRAGQVSKAQRANVKTKAVFSVGVFGAYFFEQLIHAFLKPIHSPEKGDGGTEWFSAFGLGALLACVSAVFAWHRFGVEFAVGAAAGVLLFSRTVCVFFVCCLILFIRLAQELFLPACLLIYGYFHF